MEKPSPRASSEKKPPGGMNPLLWVILVLFVGMLFSAFLYQNKPEVEIPYLELTRLIEQGNWQRSVEVRSVPRAQPGVEPGPAPAGTASATAAPPPPTVRPGPAASSVAGPAVSGRSEGPVAARPRDAERYIDVEQTAAGVRQVVRYSRLADLRVTPTEVTGTVWREVIDPAPGKPPEEFSFRTGRRGFENDNGALLNLLRTHGFTDVSAEGEPSALRQFVPMLVLLLILSFFLWFAMRRLGGAGSPMAFGRSRGKMYAQEDIGVTFEDVAGIDEAVEELREVVEFLKSPEKFQRLGARIPKGVLLIGPPGTGKTLLAKAIAGEAGVPFFSLSGSDFVEMFVGVGAARVRDMFHQAEMKAPCIIFIDELDALGKTRGTSIVGGHDEREQTLNALLVEMDGFGTNSGVIVLAATNRPETLDPALLRPGRFDRHVVVDKPDVRGREKILNVHVHDVKLDETVQLDDVAKITSGFVGADLANLVNEAALLAARKGKSAVGMDEFNEGVDRVTAGLEKKQRVMQPEEKQRIAYHEAGHALVAYSLPNTDPVHRVSIIPRGIGALGYVMRRPEQDRYIMTQGELESHIKVCLAGTLTEELIFADVSTGAQNDLERASDIARAMVMDFGMSRLGRVNYRESTRSPFLAGSGEMGREHSFSEHTSREIDQEVSRIINEAIENVRYILTTRKQALAAVAERLLEREVIDGAELKQIVDAHTSGPWVVPGTGTSRHGAGAAHRDASNLRGAIDADDLDRPQAQGS